MTILDRDVHGQDPGTESEAIQDHVMTGRTNHGQRTGQGHDLVQGEKGNVHAATQEKIQSKRVIIKAKAARIHPAPQGMKMSTMGRGTVQTQCTATRTLPPRTGGRRPLTALSKSSAQGNVFCYKLFILNKL